MADSKKKRQRKKSAKIFKEQNVKAKPTVKSNESASFTSKEKSILEESKEIKREKIVSGKTDAFKNENSFLKNDERFLGSGDRLKQKAKRKEAAKNVDITFESSIDLKGKKTKVPGHRNIKNHLTIPFAISEAATKVANDSFSENQDDNVGTKSAAFTARSTRNIAWQGENVRASRKNNALAKNERQSKVSPDEIKAFESRSSFKKADEELLKKEKNASKKKIQKKRLFKKYSKEAKKAKKNAKRAGQVVETTAEAVGKTAMFIRRHPIVTIVIVVLGLFVMMIFQAAGAGMMAGGGIGSAIISGSYQSTPAEIDEADNSFSMKELELQNRIDNIETEYPGYDEYNYNIAPIEHDPYALISYLSAKYVTFNAADMESEIQALFDEMYTLTIEERIEKRGDDPDTTEDESYEVKILDVTLTAKDLSSMVLDKLDSEQQSIFRVYGETFGGNQRWYSPVDFNWRYYIKSYYGYRKNPATGANEFHKGLDIAMPEGTEIKSAQDGTVSAVGNTVDYGNYVVIKNSDGYESKYAHLSDVSVRQGDSVKHGDIVGKSGSTGSATGSHLHLECLFTGEYYNPLFYFDSGEGGINGEDLGFLGTGGLPLMEYDDEAVDALMKEAAKYLGYPYVWGGSSPSTSFDCSGFVCWALRESGFYNTERTTAQGLCNLTTRVSASDARPGDLIFFTGTYNSGTPVSHVGIYCGNGTMIHCGDPIKYSPINTPYWQQHFYGFGRIR